MRHHGCSFEEAFRKCPQEYWLGEEPSFNKDKLDEIKNADVKMALKDGYWKIVNWKRILIKNVRQ